MMVSSLASPVRLSACPSVLPRARRGLRRQWGCIRPGPARRRTGNSHGAVGLAQGLIRAEVEELTVGLDPLSSAGARDNGAYEMRPPGCQIDGSAQRRLERLPGRSGADDPSGLNRCQSGLRRGAPLEGELNGRSPVRRSLHRARPVVMAGSISAIQLKAIRQLEVVERLRLNGESVSHRRTLGAQEAGEGKSRRKLSSCLTF